jgi:hypothetical protein
MVMGGLACPSCGLFNPSSAERCDCGVPLNRSPEIKKKQSSPALAASLPVPPIQLQPVTVTNINMPFWSMVIFMVKWAIAAIPALLILLIIAMGFESTWRVVNQSFIKDVFKVLFRM